ncbi:L-lactate dehydrogenase [Salinigranum rubrum]|uniref:Malate dehydrogenase n=1 Tax=Salinigranum rubrum TaxID=755307 RepID=A0A2I8VFL9_9EURY|nr:L-lactate dehydrogenase [Salinigranum rubrum]AUV80701.1 L-lactate dehydrogenase [Salinigranum rubrum]
MATTRTRGKVAVVGVGSVGAATAFSLMSSGVASELVLVDIDEEKAEGERMDLSHGAYFTPPVDISTGGYEDCWDADVVVVTAGTNQRPGESRLDLLERNAGIFEEMIPQITEGLADDSVLLVVTNPVDVLSYVSWEVSDLPEERVIGSGTVLDTSRFRHVLSRECDVDPKNVHGYVVGEHGDSEVMLWSSTNVAGVPYETYAARHCGGVSEEAKEEVEREVREAAYEIIERKGATNYAIALATTEIVEAVLRDENSILTVSTLLGGEYGIDDVYASVPCVVNRDGVRNVVEHDLPAEEREALEDSAGVLAESLADLDYR